MKVRPTFCLALAWPDTSLLYTHRCLCVTNKIVLIAAMAMVEHFRYYLKETGEFKFTQNPLLIKNNLKIKKNMLGE